MLEIGESLRIKHQTWNKKLTGEVKVYKEKREN